VVRVFVENVTVRVYVITVRREERHKMKNLEVAKLLFGIADILEFQGVDFKPVAYRRAASNIESLSEDIQKIYEENRLEEIPGVGKNIADKIKEYLENGKLKYYEELKKEVPIKLDELMNLPEIGPKKAKILYEKLRIKNVSDLKKAALSKKIRNIPGMGIKSEDSILKGIESQEKNKDRMLIGYALPIANEIVKRLSGLKEVDSVNVAGSVRRMKETVRDIDILIVSSSPSRVMDYFVKLNDVKEIIAKGSTKSSVRLSNGLQVDLRIVEKESYGAALNYFTGSKEHNILLRKIAQGNGLKLNEYGLFKGSKIIAGKNENEIYKSLGLNYIEPELRENTGEIISSKNNTLPNLIGYNQIKGDLQMHTKFSDGQNTIQEMAEVCKEREYKYMAITDHLNLAVTKGLDDKKINSYLKDLNKVNISGIKIFSGCEVEINKSGSLNAKTKTLKDLDIVIGAVHSNFKLSKADMTKRILNAMDNEYLTFLAHPTGRLITRREPYEFDIDSVFEKAKNNNIWIEINAHPDRLDLRDSLIRSAKEFGVKFVINTDAHSIADLHFMELGIGQSRRGWLESKDVVNTRTLKEFEKLLRNR
jgi:DNA polymerase (family X)